ncbi:efflux RND transporter periplasmic adaptor subunit [Planctomycetes bacterium K23_9]|uniref:Multidrug resistance protein MdtN n=1 Tax=Stieleria marina TaxID=1930275 RepID=A0A517NX16_9BACT|nr:multidrug resistance protein MdtN [Planctomycetes bacterium K23_9]
MKRLANFPAFNRLCTQQSCHKAGLGPSGGSRLRACLAASLLAAFGGLLATGNSVQAQQSLVYDGFTKPKYDILVAANEIGRVEEVLVEEGDQVRKGQVVARLEDGIQQASVRISEFQCTMTGEIEAAKAEVATNLARVQQVRQLAADQMAPPTELARAEADLEIAQAKHKTALEQNALRKLELKRNRVQLERRQVVAPMDGVVAKVFHQPGEYVTPSDPALIRLLVTSPLYAVFNVPVDELGSVNVDDSARVYLRSSRTSIECKVRAISPAIDGESGTVEVRVLLPNTDGKLRAGDRCTVHMKKSNQIAGVQSNQGGVK